MQIKKMGKYDILWKYFLSKRQDVSTKNEKINTHDCTKIRNFHQQKTP